MRIDFFDNHYVALGHFSEKDEIKRAGFTFHFQKKVWRTASKEVALRLLEADWTQRACDQYEYERSVQEHSYEYSWRAATEYQFPAPPGKKGFPFQQAGVEYAMMRKDTLIADEPGLGKTIQAIGVLNADESIKRALFIVPASLKINWYREIDRWMMPDLTFGIAEASRVVREQVGVFKTGKQKGQPRYRMVETIPDFWPGTDIVIINYDILERFESQIKDQGWWDLLVCDECHTLKNEKSKRTLFVLGGSLTPTKAQKAKHKEKRAAARAAARMETDPVEKERLYDIASLPDLKKEFFNPIDANRRVFLSGTPMMSRPVEFWPLVHAFDPGGLGRDYMDFVYEYCSAYTTNYGLDVSGCSNSEQLGRRLREAFMVRRLKREVLPELPAKTRIIVPLDSPEIRALVAREDELSQQLKLYESIVTGKSLDQMEAEQGTSIINYLTRIGYDSTAEDFDPEKPSWKNLNMDYAAAVAGLAPPQVAVLFEEIALVRRELGIAKLSVVIPWIEDFLAGTSETNGKIIVFAYHSDVVKAIAEALADYNPAVIWGGTPVMKRQAQVDKFQEDESCRVFVGNIHAAGVGLTLTRAADVAFAEGDWVPAMIQQCEDRACRIGQTADAIMVYFLVANGSLDARIIQAVKFKEENIASVIGA